MGIFAVCLLLYSILNLSLQLIAGFNTLASGLAFPTWALGFEHDCVLQRGYLFDRKDFRMSVSTSKQAHFTWISFEKICEEEWVFYRGCMQCGCIFERYVYKGINFRVVIIKMGVFQKINFKVRCVDQSLDGITLIYPSVLWTIQLGLKTLPMTF